MKSVFDIQSLSEKFSTLWSTWQEENCLLSSQDGSFTLRQSLKSSLPENVTITSTYDMSHTKMSVCASQEAQYFQCLIVLGFF